MSTHPDPLVRARRVLAGEFASPQELVDLARDLRSLSAFRYARRVLALAAQSPAAQNDPALRRRCILQGALSTYKDQELPADERLRRAFELLQQLGNPATTRDQELLGLAGAIYKRQFDVYARKEHLERSLTYYTRGYEQGLEGDNGYTAINAAFVLDMLAVRALVAARAAGGSPDTAEQQFERAAQIRRHLLEVLGPRANEDSWRQSWWLAATIAEAHFGLREYAEAARAISYARTLPAEPWNYESLARQLAALANLQAERDDRAGLPPGATLAWDALGMTPAAMSSLVAGRVGLALSGGGFRAALFQIGTLARLAELDLLRHLQVISCVAGGAVLGTHYYLELKRLLERKAEADITRDDYIEIVVRMERDVLAAVQQNIRVRTKRSPWAALRALLSPNYSLAEYFGTLLERHLFARAGVEARYMSDLLVRPLGAPPSFSPVYDNWSRGHKVPILVLNATALNTGHSWQFSSTWMGEPSATAELEIDDQDLLRGMYYAEAPPPHDRIRIGTAVAASACTPGLFDPIVFAGLYRDFTVRLVDGGVYDNQGVGALAEHDCTVMIVSDGSGIPPTQASPATGLIGVISRASEILMSRVRKAQYRDLQTRLQASVLRGLVFLHLKKDLVGASREPIGAPDAPEAGSAVKAMLTSYGVNRDVQSALSELRTDFDSFNDVEAYALMTSGYTMARTEIPRSAPTLSQAEVRPHGWRFLAIEHAMRSEDNEVLLRVLRVGRRRAFKAFRLSTRGRWIGAAVGAAMGVAVAGVAALLRSVQINLGEVMYWGWAAAAPVLAVFLITRRDPVQFASSLAIASFGWLLAGVHLAVTDKWFLRSGRWSAGETEVDAPMQARRPTLEPGPALALPAVQAERLRRIFELAGARMEPASAVGLVEVDFVAVLDGHTYCVAIKGGAPRDRPVDWTAASAVKRGAWQLSLGRRLPRQQIREILVLVDVPADSSLESFAQAEDVMVIKTTNEAIMSLATDSTAEAPARARRFLNVLSTVGH